VNKAIGILGEIRTCVYEINEESMILLSREVARFDRGEDRQSSMKIHVHRWKQDMYRISALLDELEALG
jgi:hypothetical protein